MDQLMARDAHKNKDYPNADDRLALLLSGGGQGDISAEPKGGPSRVEKPKPDCVACGQKIPAGAIQFNNKNYHPACLVCTTCGKKLTTGVYTAGGKLYCEPHKRALDAPACAKCGEQILEGKVRLTKRGLRYHDKHFQCSVCEKLLGDKHWTHKGELFCKTHVPAKKMITVKEKKARDARKAAASGDASDSDEDPQSDEGGRGPSVGRKGRRPGAGAGSTSSKGSRGSKGRKGLGKLSLFGGSKKK